jgi:hypothetical protein
MDAFRVWVRSMGSASRVRVEGIENARWLLGRLSRSFVFKSSEPIHEERDTTCCTFRVPYGSHVSLLAFEKLLTRIPEVRLIPDPA